MNDKLTSQLTEEQWIDWLDGKSCPEAEALANEHAELSTFRKGDQKLRQMISSSLPAAEEPPFPDFLNSRIEKEIRDSKKASTAPATTGASFWQGLRWLIAPLAAAACFVLGLMMGEPGSEASGAGGTIAASPLIYTPDGNVSSVVDASGESTVIILDGLSDIPDTVDFFETVRNNAPSHQSFFVNTSLQQDESSAQ